MSDKIAKLFHETYERLAPEHGYKTRTESAVPWEQVPENNRNLMIATVKEVLGSDDVTIDLLKKAIAEWSTEDGRIFNGERYSQMDCVIRATTLMAAHNALEGDTSMLEDLAYDTATTKIKN